MFYKVKPEQQSLLLQGNAPLAHLPDRGLTLTLWNVWKAKKGQTFFDEFFYLKKQSDFLLLQEAHSRMFQHEDWADVQTKMQIKMFSSFDYAWTPHSTGVMTMSRVHSPDVLGLRFPDRELNFLTPKSGLLSRYADQADNTDKKETLTVLNLHFLNFVPQSMFERNFMWLLQNLRGARKGPLIVAGDLNTWSLDRLEFVHKNLATYGVEPVFFENDFRRMKLDHIFIRDVEILQAKVLKEITSSDHFPLQVTFRLKSQAK